MLSLRPKPTVTLVGVIGYLHWTLMMIKSLAAPVYAPVFKAGSSSKQMSRVYSNKLKTLPT